MSIFIYPYNSNSESAKLLSEELGAKRIKLQNSEFVSTPQKLIVNWGNSNCPFSGENVLNKGAAIKETVNKLRFFRLMMQRGLSGYPPPYWTDPRDIGDEAFPIFCRTTTTGMDGAGIVIAEKREELVAANLYTAMIKSSTEYRVTLFRETVTDIQTKLPRQGQNAHPYIRTYANGWGFQRKDVPENIKTKLIAAARSILLATGLDFAGIDMLYDATLGRVTVLEVNTAMGLEGGALERFAAAVASYYRENFEFIAPAEIPAVEPDIIKAASEGRWLDVIKIASDRLSQELTKTPAIPTLT